VRDSELVVDHYLHPRNQGAMDDADAQSVTHNPACGDTTYLYLKIKNGVIARVRWRTEGCGTSIAASSIASEMLEGVPIAEAAQLTRERIDQAMGGLLPAKAHAAVLAADAIRSAIARYQARAKQSNAAPGRASA
jgi:nitrogen fixation NifU-like protein